MSVFHQPQSHKAGAQTDKVKCIVVVVSAVGGRQNVSGVQIRVRLLHPHQVVQLHGGDYALLLHLPVPDHLHHLLRQIRPVPDVLELDIQLDPSLAVVQRLLQGGNLLPGEIRPEPAAHIQIPHLAVGHAPQAPVHAG